MTLEAAEIAKLAERVEAATGADRELDAEIANAAGHGQLRNGRLYRWAYDGSTNDVIYPLDYTASLDAAMTLVDGVGVLLGLSDIGADGLPLARVGVPHLSDAPVFSGIASCIMTKTAPISGLALALTAAALKARARATLAERSESE